jgi:UDP-N-acetylmuramoylalanine--D-glutamate ligase
LKIPGVKKFLGPNYLKHLPEVRTLFRSPGIRPIGAGVAQNRTGALQNRGGVLQYAPTQYAPTSLTQFFFDHAPTQKIIGVTGTKGKGTTSTLIHNILRRAGKNVFLGGNIGVSPLEFLEVLTPNDFVVLELSSFQLMDLNRSPHIAVLLQTTSEHLDYHKDTAEYLNAKKNLVAHQRLGDFFIHHAETDCAEDFKKVTPAVALNYSRLQCKGVLQYAPTNGFVDNNKLWIKLPHWEHAEWIAEIGKIGLRGEHNFENIFAAALATSLSGSDLKSIRTEIKNFRGLPHRLELVGELDSVEYFNDSFSTTPETTIAALKSFPEKSGIVVILGGSEKGSDYTELGQVISQLQNLRAVVLIGVTAPKIRAAIERAGGTVQFLDGGKTMREIIQTARSVAQTGDAVLLSPACASFDLFKNYKERGEEFKSMVQESISP